MKQEAALTDTVSVCGFGQGHREPDPVPMPVRAKSPEDPKQMQRKRTGPKAPWLDASWLSQWLWFGRCQQRERGGERERGPPRCNIQFLGVRTTYRDPARKMTFHSLDTNQSLSYFSRPPLSARAPRREFLRLFASESAANTPHTHYNTLMPPHRPVVLTGSSLVAFAKSPAARELSGRPEWAQDTAKTGVCGRNVTWTQLRGTSVGKRAPSWLVLVCGS